jgi:gamma-glutamyltranspeptidase/glutathione hydrolase
MTDDAQKWIRNYGPKPQVGGFSAACSSDNAIVTDTILTILKEGGNAIDATIAGCMVQAAIEPFMTNHAGTVTLLYHEAKTGRRYQLDSAGFLPHDLPPFRPLPPRSHGWGATAPAACLPGFMPGIKAMYERFGTMPWRRLCEDAIRWAEEGHPVSTFEYSVNIWLQEFMTYFPEGRALFQPGGHFVPVGERFRLPDLARTLRGVAEDGPGHMIEGPWARDFVAKANAMGWRIGLEHMTATPPRWIEPFSFRHHDHEVLSLAPPQQQGISLCFMTGVLRHLGIRDVEPGSAEHLFWMAHTLRSCFFHTGMLGDPIVSDYGFDQLCDEDFQAGCARMIRGVMPKVDLTQHVRMTAGPGLVGHKIPDTGLPTRADAGSKPSMGSCELAVVDGDGNWVQMMNTMQSGGIPGMVVGGVAMAGTHASLSGVNGFIGARLAKGARLRQPVGNTIVYRDGVPVMSLGTPGNPHCTTIQVLTNLLDFGMTPEAAIDAPRLLPLGEDGSLTIEDRISPAALAGLERLGVQTRALGAYDWPMGSFQMCFRDPATGALGAAADPRRCGVADGIA